MKKLSIEQKAKRYDEALEGAKKLYEQGTITESLSYVFPELRESGDEEVRKEIMQLFRGMYEADPRKERWLAWLEKQGQVNKTIISQHENKTCKENNYSLTSEDERIRK